MSCGSRTCGTRPSNAFAAGPDSPFPPLEQSGTGSDNIYYTGNPDQPCNGGSGLGYPNLSLLAADFAASRVAAADVIA